jgi:hypothetical protein
MPTAQASVAVDQRIVQVIFVGHAWFPQSRCSQVA